jgi:hexokinase
MAKIDLQAWLIKQKISVDSYNANELIQKFQDEMKKGLNGEKSSLAMIPSYFGIDKKSN